mgnify:FL=1
MKSDFTAGFVALGLIGGSIARAIKHFYPEATVLACARRRETLTYALEEHIIDEAYDDICEAFSRCDFIFLCAPVEVNIDSLSKIKPFLKADCILTDVGSTKTDIHERAAALGLSDWFIGGHPMAGSEKTGIEHSQWALIENAYYILTPSAGIAPEKVTRYTKLVSSLNALPLCPPLSAICRILSQPRW